MVFLLQIPRLGSLQNPQNLQLQKREKDMCRYCCPNYFSILASDILIEIAQYIDYSIA